MSKRTNRKQEIVFAALEIISEEGVRSLTMKRIGEKVGISDAALYRHFDSKHSVIRELILEVGRNLNANIGSAVATIENPIEKLKEILRIHLAYLEDHKGIPRLVFSEEIHQNDPVLRNMMFKVVNHYLDMIRGILWRAKETGQVRSDIDIEATAIVFLGQVQAMAFLWSLSGFDFSLHDRAPALWRAFSESLK